MLKQLIGLPIRGQSKLVQQAEELDELAEELKRATGEITEVKKKLVAQANGALRKHASSIKT
jgi:hypothetical protein